MARKILVVMHGIFSNKSSFGPYLDDNFLINNNSRLKVLNSLFFGFFFYLLKFLAQYVSTTIVNWP